MAVDEMYMENLDEFVNDENKVVTFKWLSTNLKVHVNQAKQMLYAFVQQERNKKENDHLNVTYFVAGIPQKKNGIQAHQCIVVPEEDLDAVKSTLSTVTSCHIYSVQKVKLKDPGTLYTADYGSTKEKIFNCNKYSAISYSRAKARSKDELAKLGAQLPETKTNASQVTSKPSANGNTGSKPSANGSTAKVKQEPKGSIANMFSGGGKKKPESEKSETPAVKEVEKDKPKQTKGGKGGMMSFFSKQAEKPKAAEKKEDTVKEPENTKTKETKKDTKETKKDTKETKSETKTEAKKKGRPSKGKKSERVSDSEDEKPDKKRRKRIRDDLFASSSSKDEMEVLEESPVPSPVREPSPEIESPVTKKSQKPESEDEVEVVSQTNGSGKRRKRTRKLVPKTFMDDEGFMVTEKVWESDSTDASEREDEKKAPSPAKQSKTQTSKTSPKKKSPPANNAKSGRNQTSLTSFFKKK